MNPPNKPEAPALAKPAPHVAAAQFPGDPANVQPPLLKKIAAYINDEKMEDADTKLVEKWAAAHKAIYID